MPRRGLTACWRVMTVGALLGLAGRAWGEDWPGFRGANRDGQCAEKGLMTAWPEGGPVRMATMGGLGRGYSSATVVQGRIYITGAVDEKEFAYCLETSGKKLWDKVICAGVKATASPASTPSVDGGRVYVRNLEGAVVCLDAKTGEIVWTVDVLKEFKGVLSPEGWTGYRWSKKQINEMYGGENWPGFNDEPVTESVLVEGDKVICTPGGPDATLVALDKVTGKTVWTSKGVSDPPSVCSPISFEFGGVRQIVTVTATGVVGVAAADGKLMWRCDAKAAVAAPLYKDGIVFIGGPGGAVQLSKQGEKIQAAILYTINGNRGWMQGGFDASNLQIMGAVLSDGFVYGSSSDCDRARTCVELATGKSQHHVTENAMSGRATGPVIEAEGMLYYQSEFGGMRLVEANPKTSKVISTFWFPYLNGRTYAHPAISDRKLFVRNQDRLFVYDIAATSVPAAAAKSPSPAPAVGAAAKGVMNADWPQFRGPNRDGKSTETGLLKTWPAEGPPLLRTIDVGTGTGSPAIVKDRIYIPGAKKRDGFITCLNLDGDQQWQVPIGPVSAGGGTDFGPASTPTIENDILYFSTDGGVVMALDTRDGHELWKVDTHKKFAGHVAAWGHTESVLVEGDKVIVTPGGPNACMVALNKKTGETVWKTEGLSDPCGNGSIIAFEFAGQRLLATVTGRSLVCVAAKDGKFLWRYDRPSTWYPPHAGGAEAGGGHNVSTPFFVDGLLGAFNIHVSGGALRLSAEGGEVKAEQVWDSHALWPKASSYIPVDGYLYGCGLPGNGAAFTCVELATGKTMFYKADNDTGGPFVYADGMFYCTGFRSGPNVSLVEQTPTGLHKAGRFKFFGECISYPAISGGRLYLRPMNGKVYVYDIRDRKAALGRTLREKYGLTLEGPALAEKLAAPDGPMAEKLLAALQDDDATIRAGVIDVIAGISPENSAAIAVLAQGFANDKTKTALAEAFVKLDPKRPEIVAPLASQLDDKAMSVQTRAIENLATVAPVNAAAGAVLAQKLQVASLRTAIIVALIKHDPKHPELGGAIRDVLAGNDTECKIKTLTAVAEFHGGIPELLKILQAGLKDPSAEVRERTVAALLSTGTRDKDTMLALAQAYSSEKDENVRRTTQDLLAGKWDRRPTLELTVNRFTENEITLSANTYMDPASAADATHWRIDGVEVSAAKLLRQDRTMVLTSKNPLPWGKEVTIVPVGVTTPEGLAPLPIPAYKVLPGIPMFGEGVRECLVGEMRAGVKIADTLTAGVLDEKTLRPRAGEAGWRLMENQWSTMDITSAVKSPRDAVIHAHVYVYSDAPRHVQLWLGTNDGVRVCVNGAVVWTSTKLREMAADQDKIENVALQKGWNRLLLMLSRNGGPCEFSLRIMDEKGLKPSGLSYSALEPEKVAPTAN